MVTTIGPRANETSDYIEEEVEGITTVIPRDTMTRSERYIIFTDNNKIPENLSKVAESIGYVLVDMDDYAIDYKHKELDKMATCMLRKGRSSPYG